MTFKKFLKKSKSDKLTILATLHTDLMFFDAKLESMPNSDKLRNKRQKLEEKFTKDKKGQMLDTEKNKKLNLEIMAIEGVLNGITKLETEKGGVIEKIDNFGIYADTLNNLTIEQKREIESVFRSYG